MEVYKFEIKRLTNGKYYGSNGHYDVTQYHDTIEEVIDIIDNGIYNGVTNLGCTTNYHYKAYKRPRNNVYGKLTVKVIEL